MTFAALQTLLKESTSCFSIASCPCSRNTAAGIRSASCTRSAVVLTNVRALQNGANAFAFDEFCRHAHNIRKRNTRYVLKKHFCSKLCNAVAVLAEGAQRRRSISSHAVIIKADD